MALKTNSLGTEKLSSLMVKMAIPTIVAQIINVLYNIVDRIYIGHIPNASADALTGVGVAFPIITFISAFAAFVGAGGASLFAIWQGKGDKEKAEKIMGNGVTLLLLFSTILIVFFYIFMKPLMYTFGASENTIGYGYSYLSVYLAGTFFVEIAMGLSSFIVAQGQSKIAMIAIVAGALLNIILDPIFIFIFKLGVVGAALASIISQFVSSLIVLCYLCSKKSKLRIKIANLKPDFKIIKNTLSLGMSPFVMQSTESLVIIALNYSMKKFGGAYADLYIGSITIMQSVMQLLAAPLAGFTQGVQPIISYNFGAGNFDRVKKTYRSMIAITTIFSASVTAFAMIFPELVASLFTDSQELITLCSIKMPLFLCGMLIFGLQNGIQPTFLALGQAKISIFIASLRKIILLIPLAIILPYFLDTNGVYIAEPISDIISVTVAVILFKVNIKKILTKDALNKIN